MSSANPGVPVDRMAAELAQYDLLPKIAPYFDKHLLFPLLEYISKQEVRSFVLFTRGVFLMQRWCGVRIADRANADVQGGGSAACSS